MRLVDRLGSLFLLVSLGYLGFYIFGLIMGVFSPTDAIGIAFTALAALFLTSSAVYAARIRRATPEPDQQARIVHEVHVQRERRGY